MVTSTDAKCAACGKGGDGLKKCGACELVRYCGAACQRAHRPQHKRECKKRAAELHDEALFKQPPSQEECPICFLEPPFAQHSIAFKSCCGKIICSGCMYAEAKTQSGGRPVCPFCREPKPCSYEEAHKRLERRVKLNDTMAIFMMGRNYFHGEQGLQQDNQKGLELLHRAAELGSITAHYDLGCVYYYGMNRVDVDKKKANYYWEIAAMSGHIGARYNLGVLEGDIGNLHRAMKHYMLSASAGDDDSLKMVQTGYRHGFVTKDDGIVSKDDFEKILRAHKKSNDELKSEWRDKAAAANYLP